MSDQLLIVKRTGHSITVIEDGIMHTGPLTKDEATWHLAMRLSGHEGFRQESISQMEIERDELRHENDRIKQSLRPFERLLLSEGVTP